MTSVVARGNREKTYLSTEGDKGMVVEGEEERWSNGVTKWGLIYAEIAGGITRSTFLHLVDEMAKPSLEHVVRGALLCPIFGGKAGMHYIIDCINEGIYLRVNNIDEFFLPHCPKRVPPNWSKAPSRLPGFVCTLPRSGTPSVSSRLKVRSRLSPLQVIYHFSDILSTGWKVIIIDQLDISAIRRLLLSIEVDAKRV
ncbi:hypothetical protein DFH09DRAFT_1079145 [Mycena vulgaris]|nr:hypothetical protein DFH09DRAFT_1079145 [Mycena vulgaris]